MSLPTAQEEVTALSAPLTLPCGLVLPNRLVKAAMEEMLGELGGGNPTARLNKVYEEWSRGNWGMVLTGNVQVSPTHLGSPADVVVPFPSSPTYDTSLQAFTSWCVASKSISPTPTIVQLCHTGRQSMRGVGRSLLEPSKAPSAVPLDAGKGVMAKAFSRIVWGTPTAMKKKDLDDVVEAFVQGARVAKLAGFDGVQLHCSHGYLLAQFMSPNVNLRTDSYGVTAKGRAKLLFRIIDAIRLEYPLSSGFCLGIKLNSSDYVKGGLTEADALDNVRWIAEHGGMDFIEISGGTYEAAVMLQDSAPEPVDSQSFPTSSKKSSSAREAFFISFSHSAKQLLSSLDATTLPSPPPAILVTGGFRTRSTMASSLIDSATDLVGIGRPACADPYLPLTLLNSGIEQAKSEPYEIKGTALLKHLPIGIIGPGLSTVFHTILLGMIAKGEKPDVRMSIWEGAWKLWLEDLVGGWLWYAWLGVVMAIGYVVVTVGQ